jgi:ABC-type antimicrobial peptide transport system ATPase subunit
MATDKKFAVAGVSTLEGKTKVRFANDTMRIKILSKNGHKDVELIELPHEMTKGEIAQHMIAVGFGKGNPAVEAAVAYVAKKNPTAKSAVVTNVTAATAETVTA